MLGKMLRVCERCLGVGEICSEMKDGGRGAWNRCCEVGEGGR